MSYPSVDVLVAGAGPTGLVAAISLVQHGVRVRIIDKLPHYFRGQRGAGIVPRVLEHYGLLGVLDDVKRDALPFLPFMQYNDNGKPERTFEMSARIDATPDVPMPNSVMLGQDRACAILRDHLRTHGVEVELATELLDLEQDESGVTASVGKAGAEERESIRVKYVVGADGAKGNSRRLLGVKLLGDAEYAGRMVIGDVEVHGLDREHWHKFGNQPGNVVTFRPTDRSAKENVYFFAGVGPDFDFARAVDDHDYLRQFVSTVANNSDIKLGRIENVADWKPNVRMVDAFRVGRVFLAGDAAHIHSPTGGQGMNSSVMDAMNLGWKLSLVCKGLALPSLLDSYNEERLPVIQKMLQITTKLLVQTFNPSGSDAPDSAWKRPASFRQLGVHCRWSSVVVDEFGSEGEEGPAATASTYVSGGRVHAGDRAPDAPALVNVKTGVTTTLFKTFGSTYHTVLTFGSVDAGVVSAKYRATGVRIIVLLPKAAESLQENVAPDGSDVIVLRDNENHAYSAYNAGEEPKIAIVRPDGVVGGLVKGKEGVDAYFSRVFA
ncbi:FAD binding domain-containing protein [Amylostereum chailletii]|nr:FAD binding domain-containing protein [Amylostereum chailletii]